MTLLETLGLWALIVGSVGFILKQMVPKLFLERLHDLRQEIADIDASLAYHAPTILTPISRTKESSDSAYDALQKHSAQLRAKLHAIPKYGVVRLLYFGALPSEPVVEQAAIQLRGLSTYMYEHGEEAMKSLDDIRRRLRKIAKLLCLKPIG